MGLTTALLTSSAQVAEASATSPTPQPKSPPTKQVSERPDRVSAALTARLQNSRVLITDETTESTLTYANPNSTFTAETVSGIARVQQGDKWVPVDTTLIEDNGVLRPRAAKAELEFSAGGQDRPMAKMTYDDKQSFTLGWPTELPKPTIKGNVATYPNAAGPNADLVVTALPTGFRHDVILRERPPGPVEFKIPVKTDGLKLAMTEQGGLKFTNTKGKIVASAPEPFMYDSPAANTAQPAGTEREQAEIDTSIEVQDGQQTLLLKPDAKFLADPDTQYPVTVDPTVTLSAYGEWTVRSPNSGHGGLVVGTNDWYQANTRLFERAVLNFNTTSLVGQVITDARMELQSGYESWGCFTGQTVKVQRATSSTGSGANWPGPTTTTSGEQLGQEPASCAQGVPVGTWTWPMTEIVQAWASGAPRHGVMLRLVTEDPVYERNSYSRMFYSSSDGAQYAPKLVVTYGATPSTQGARTTPVAVVNQKIYTNTTTPTLRAWVNNPQGGLLRADYVVERDPESGTTGQLWSGSVSGIQAGAEAKVAVPASKIPDGTKIRWRVRSYNGTDYSAWSPWQVLEVDATPPQAPANSDICSFDGGYWLTRTTGEQLVGCDLSTPSMDTIEFLWGMDDPSTPNAQTASDMTSKKFATVYVDIADLPDGRHAFYAKARDKAHNTSTAFVASFGIGPGGMTSPKDKSRTQRSVSLIGAGPSTRTSIRYEYRKAGSGATTYSAVPPADVTIPGSGQPIASWPQTRTDTSKDFSELSWDLAKTLGDANIADGAVELRACLSGGSAAEACSKPVTVTLDRSAFGGSYATAKIGPGEVALQTGDFSLKASDASLFGVEVSRTLTTLNPAANRQDEQLAENKIFGPGWRAGFPAAPSGIAEFAPTSTADSMQLVGSSGETLTYVRNGEIFSGIGDAADGSKITAGAEELIVNDASGAKTTYTKSNGKWVIARAEGPATESAVTYYRDGQGRVTRVLAPAPTGVTCGATLVAGCRALEITYAATTTATGTGSGWGDYKDLAKNVSFTAFDPESNAMKTTVLTSYLYDSTGHLRQVTDPRTALTATYYYNAEGRISQITPPGLAPWRMEYDTSGRLAHVQREGGAVDPTWAVAYDVPIGGTGAPIDLTMTQTAKWGQAVDLPTIGTAVFPASHLPVQGSSGAYQPTASDWEHSEISYMDVNGRPVNVANYGAGAWQVGSNRYDDKGNTVWELSASNRAQALTPTADTDPYVSGRSDSAERANLLALVNTYNTDSDLLTKEGPAHQVKLASGAYATVREHTTLTYDEGKPQSNIGYHLVTTAQNGPVVLDGTATPGAADTRTAKVGYDPISSGDKSGWDLRGATSSTAIVNGQADLVRKTRYNAKGQVIEERTPQSNGADAGTTVTTYYTADGSGPAECRKPEWAGLVCQSGPKAQPSSGKPLPISHAVAYNHFGLPTIGTETAGTITRTVTTRYDAAGRSIGLKTTVTPEAEGGTPVPETTTTYDPATGLVTGVTTGAVSTTTAYDAFGRAVSYTDADGNTSTATYTLDDKVATATDGKGTTTYTYDGTDYRGRQERRGLLTKVDTPGVGAFQGVYGEDGQLVQQAYPNSLVAEYRYDNAGRNVALTYAKDQTRWLEFTNTPGTSNTIAQATSPLSRQDYTYDTVGRLTKVADTYNQRCTTRAYAFTPNTNRSRLDTYAPGASGECATTGTPATVSYTYDEADRLTSPGYAYDAFGRTTTVPAAHASGGGDLSVGYHANDMVASMQQAGINRTFTLDPEGRIRSTVQTGGTRPGTLVNHYDSSSDEPVWIAEADGSWSRNLEGIAGGLGAIQYSTGQVTLQLANLDGDVVATADAGTLTSGIGAYFEQTEYGLPRTENTVNPVRYGWLGSHQRSADALAGVILMGVRLYNPITARFLQVDPVVRGSANAYEYCYADPINCSDINGMFGVYYDWKTGTFTFVFSPAEAKYVKEVGWLGAIGAGAGAAGSMCGWAKDKRVQVACGAVAAGIGVAIAGIINASYKEGKVLVVRWTPNLAGGTWTSWWQDPPKGGKVTHPKAVYIGHLDGVTVGSRLVRVGGGSKLNNLLKKRRS
ncbi:RHS repeat-associated core domain-containing protein [Streptosporangium sp. NPDC002544]|uniref:RHS repeat-associated core domain-containing protein n=1 Tax=Streptosporangium sp. NPDC002544 TaxID=3154538 RepID=UPI003328CB2D